MTGSTGGQIVPTTLREVRQARVALSRRERRLLQELLGLAAQPCPRRPAAMAAFRASGS